MTELDGTADAQPTALWKALRLDPGHASEVAVLYALPQLTPRVEAW